MSIVAGVDFGTLSVRVSIFDSERGRLGAGTAEYPLLRKKDDPDHATQSHADHMRALAEAMHRALASAGRRRRQPIEAIALDTTGSSVIPVDEKLEPLDDYYLWCDHRAWQEAAEITAAAHAAGPGGHRLVRRHLLFGVGLRQAAALAAPQSRKARALRHGAGALRHGGGGAVRHHRPGGGAAQRLRHGPQVDVERRAGRASAGRVPDRGGSAAGRRARQTRRPLRDFGPDRRPPVGRSGRRSWGCARAFRFRWARSTRIGTPSARACGWATWSTWSAPPPASWRSSETARADSRRVRRGAGIGGSGAAPASKRDFRRPAISSTPSRGAPAPRWRSFRAGWRQYRAGETGLLRLTWDNGDRTVLVNPELSGVTLGWRLTHTAQDELFAAIEGTAFHTRVILERMEEHGVPVRRDHQRRRHSAEECRC